MSPRRALTDSPFDTLEKTFDLLVEGPRPLALDTTGIAGLPDGPVPLGELRARLLHPSARFTVRDAALGALVARAQSEGGRWTVGLGGVLLPGLRSAVYALARVCPASQEEIEAEALVAFVAAVARARPGRRRMASWLCWQAHVGARKVIRAELAELAGPSADPVPCAPPRPWGHPDFVLAKAVRLAVIEAADAALIDVTRLDGADIAVVAEELGLDYETCRARRGRAEAKLRDYIKSDWYLPFDFVGKGAKPPCSSSRGRPRQDRSKDRRPGERHDEKPPRR
ncbi:MAG: hypothetical protein ACRDWN_09780 [Acidimicrobiales bacterium]